MTSISVISFSGGAALYPRAVRTRAILDRLVTDHDVEFIAPSTGGVASIVQRARSGRLSRLQGRVVRSVLIDKHEPVAYRTLRPWRPQTDVAILVGFPFSPLPIAARKLIARGIPYVVDIGDPWCLTAGRQSRNVAGVRARRLERALWEHCAGGIVTTELQKEALTSLFPSLDMLVRPNGYHHGDVAISEVPATPARASNPHTLRLVHFGEINSARLDVRPTLQKLAAAGRWRQVHVTQYGTDYAGMLSRHIPGVSVERRAPVPWARAIDQSAAHDAALVIGNTNPVQLPSKAIQYLTLPIPRLAVTNPSQDDSLAVYVSDKPGWGLVRSGADDAPHVVATLVDRNWSRTELAAPSAEEWAAVAGTIVRFVEQCARLRPPGAC